MFHDIFKSPVILCKYYKAVNSVLLGQLKPSYIPSKTVFLFFIFFY